MQLAIIGGGPAGLRAAEVAAAGGANVTVFEGKPSVGRKFLVAGRGGLNLTNAEPREHFATRYSAPAGRWPALLAECDAEAVRAWAAGLGVETFAASTGRVFPRELRSATLLRRWVQRLRSMGVRFAMRHRWRGLRAGPPWQVDFATPHGRHTHESSAVLLALGGGSWPETGSDGAWIEPLAALGVDIAPLAPANGGWEFPWPPAVLAAAEGQPLKNLACSVADMVVHGELLVTRYGLEGGALYQLGPALRTLPQPMLTIDFKPANTAAQLTRKLASTRGELLAVARDRWRLSPGAHAILTHLAAPHPTAEGLAVLAKKCPLVLTGPRPLAEAISSAGGVRWSELDDALMLRRNPGIFLAGEMIDWEAPTGGYLLQGCFATGTRAGRGALAWLAAHSGLRR